MRIQGLYLLSANLEKFCFFLLSMSHQDLFALYDISVQIDNVKLGTVHLCNLCTVYLQMVFEPCKGGKSWMLEHNEISRLQRSALSEQSKSLPVSIGSTTDIGLLRSLEPASKRDILGIVLRNLKTVYWKRASRARPGLTISAPLQLPGAGQHDSIAGKMNLPVGALLRPQDLRY
jgi:hypothetical protein